MEIVAIAVFEVLDRFHSLERFAVGGHFDRLKGDPKAFAGG